MANSCVLIWFNSILRTVSSLPCPWPRQFDRTEIMHSPGLSVSFRAEGHDKRDTAFHVLSRQTFVEPWLIHLEFKIWRAKLFICQFHAVFPTAEEVQHSGASCTHHNSSVPILQVSLLFCPSTTLTLPHRKPASTTQSCAISHDQTIKRTLCSLTEPWHCSTLLWTIPHMATGNPLPFLP